MNHRIYTTTLFTAALAGIGMAQPALAQSAESEIVVTARRVEERLQDVPIAITVFNQDQLSDRNISSPADLALYTPSLNAETRFGSDLASFSIRGFAQESRTTASVATYFADVVSPRNGPTAPGGDGAAPGSLFDLQNVQVLKGPQGTLFGRNTTGGAVLFVPQRPGHEFGGYVEATAGDYGLERYQAVLNVPFSDSARLRLGMDRQTRDGYLDNRSGVGPDDFGDVNYEAYRVSFIADLTPNLENYTIASYTHALTNGNVAQQYACSTARYGAPPCSYPGLDASGDYAGGDYEVWNSDADAHYRMNQWQLINATTWDVSDNFTIRNIMSYAEFNATNRGDVFGLFWTSGGLDGYVYANSSQTSDVLAGANQATYSEELQFQGRTSDNRLTWQAGLYFEESDPLELTGSVSEGLIQCTDTSDPDPGNWYCIDSIPGSPGQVARNLGRLSYQNQAIYAQGTYALTDRLKFTAGYRYTWDRTDSAAYNIAWNDYPDAGGVDPDGYECVDATSTSADCEVIAHQRSSAPTWTIGLDYFLTDDDMVYAKYTRGYRQGAINVFGVAGVYAFDPEEVNAYEVGLKSTFDGPFPGIFNLSVFYNDLSNAQLQTAIVPVLIAGSPTTAIVNAGGVTMYGAEIEASAELFEGFQAYLGASFLDTNVDSPPLNPALDAATCGIAAPPCYFISQSYVEGQDLVRMPETKYTIGLNYRLPLPENIGEVSLGANYSYVGQQLFNRTAGPAGVLPEYELLNLNLNWDNIGGGPVDASLFVTNALDELYYTAVNNNLSIGFESRNIGPPRMFGARLRYSFGGE